MKAHEGAKSICKLLDTWPNNLLVTTAFGRKDHYSIWNQPRPCRCHKVPGGSKMAGFVRPGKAWNSQAAETPGDPGRTVGACHWENNEKPWDFRRFPMTLQRSPEPRAFKACPPPYSRAGPRKAAPFLRQVMALAKAGGLRMCAVPEYMIVQTSINHRYDRER